MLSVSRGDFRHTIRSRVSIHDTIEVITTLKNWLGEHIIGQEKLIDRLLIALLADGHLLVEGAPGLAKTKAIKNLSEGLRATSTESSSHLTCCQ